MFAKAYQLAAGFTRPVVISKRTISGVCSTSIGAFVVVNDDGWVLTAWHIIEAMAEVLAAQGETRAHLASVATLRNDASLDKRERERRLRKLGDLDQGSVTNCSFWWGCDGVTAVTAVANMGLPDVDIGIARLQPFDPTWVKNYPVFKAPHANVDHGTSLCKLGFPFYEITPTWDDAQDVFVFPPTAVPIPFFPIDGIFTRTLTLPIVPGEPYPKLLMETSSPGLRGQSGGPTFDVKGTVWAIQSKTAHLPLGFDPEVPGQKTREHQFLNVGRGVHTETIIGFLNQNNIKHSVSDY